MRSSPAFHSVFGQFALLTAIAVGTSAAQVPAADPAPDGANDSGLHETVTVAAPLRTESDVRVGTAATQSTAPISAGSGSIQASAVAVFAMTCFWCETLHESNDP